MKLFAIVTPFDFAYNKAEAKLKSQFAMQEYVYLHIKCLADCEDYCFAETLLTEGFIDIEDIDEIINYLDKNQDEK